MCTLEEGCEGGGGAHPQMTERRVERLNVYAHVYVYASPSMCSFYTLFLIMNILWSIYLSILIGGRAHIPVQHAECRKQARMDYITAFGALPCGGQPHRIVQVL